MDCVKCGSAIEADSKFCRHCGQVTGEGAATGQAPRRVLVRRPEAGRIAGVCAGLAEYLDTDVTFVRLAWVILSIVPGCIIGGLIAYIAAWIVVPPGGETPSTERQPGAQLRPRLTRSTANRKLGGVCGGIAEYFGVDATLIRLLWVILAIFPGTILMGVIGYVVAWFIMPEGPAESVMTAPSAA